jgi:hypothetical protein
MGSVLFGLFFFFVQMSSIFTVSAGMQIFFFVYFIEFRVGGSQFRVNRIYRFDRIHTAMGNK